MMRQLSSTPPDHIFTGGELRSEQHASDANRNRYGDGASQFFSAGKSDSDPEGAVVEYAEQTGEVITTPRKQKGESGYRAQ